MYCFFAVWVFVAWPDAAEGHHQVIMGSGGLEGYAQLGLMLPGAESHAGE